MAKTYRYSTWIPKRFNYLVLGILLLSISSGLQGTTQTIQIPSLAEATRRADQLAPKDLAQIEVDESIRDRLRFDPEWQPILQAVRQDIIILKWGKGYLANPAWKQYGPKVYPLLDYYIRSGDPTRETYGILGIRALGKPYTTLWLERYLKRHANLSDFSLVDPEFYPYKTYSREDCADEDCWEKTFGLNDSVTRDHLIQIARQNLEPRSSPIYEDQFNLAFLKAVGDGKGIESSGGSSSESDSSSIPKLQQWLQFENLRSPDDNQIKSAIAYYRTLPGETQKYILVNRLGEVKAGDISPIGKALLRNLSTDRTSRDRMWAIAELNRHGDPQAKKSTKEIINRDLEQLYDLTGSTSLTFGKYPSGHVTLLLIALAKEYPESKFIQGCVEYGDLRGTSYFGQEPRSKAIRNKNASKEPTEWVRDWQQWLSRYPDHPGADDATYFLAKSLQDENNVLEAMRQFIKMMTQRLGDGDALELAWPHVRSLLDVGLSVEQLKVLLQEQRNSAIVPLLQYALAVQQARLQNYADALSLTEGLDLTKMPSYVLTTYYYRNSLEKPEIVQKEAQLFLMNQRQRWQKLRNWKIENTPDSLYQIASDWAGSEGWRNGYLSLWDNNRSEKAPVLEAKICKEFWVCDFRKRNLDTVRAAYQSANSNSVALSLYQSILSNPRTSPSLREKTLFMVASTLLSQWEIYPTTDIVSTYPLPGMTEEPQVKNIYQAESALDDAKEKRDRAWQENSSRGGKEDAARRASRAVDQAEQALKKTKAQAMKIIQQSYQRRIDEVISQLQTTFPKSVYIDDLLFSNYFFSGQRQYLEKIVKLYPNGDRTAEAKFLLEQSKRSPPKTHK